jgi:hypothetical protein
VIRPPFAAGGRKGNVMDSIWLMLIVLPSMTVYFAVVVRAALNGKRWAVETLHAMSLMSEDRALVAAWLRATPMARETDAARCGERIDGVPQGDAEPLV